MVLLQFELRNLSSMRRLWFFARFPSVSSFCGNIKLERTNILRRTHIYIYIIFRKHLWARSHVVLLSTTAPGRLKCLQIL